MMTFLWTACRAGVKGGGVREGGERGQAKSSVRY